MNNDVVNIHLIWLGSPLNEKRLSILEKWETIPNANVFFWNEETISELDNGVWHDKTLSPVIRSDVLRVYVTWLFGGWYSDFSTLPGGQQLYNSEKYIFVRQDSTTLLNGFFYSPKKHPFGEYLLDSLNKSNLLGYAEVDYSSGPFALMRALYTFVLINPFQSSNELEYLPFGDYVSIPQSIVSDSIYPIKHGRIATDLGESSWNKIANVKKKHKFLRRVLYLLKRNKYFEIIFRFPNILTNRPLFKISKITGSPILLLRNFIPRVLQIHELEICEIETMEEFISLVPKLNIVAVISMTDEISSSIHLAGWLPCKSKNTFLRPRITNYLKQQTQLS